MPPKDAFSSSANNIRGMLHSSIADIDAMLRSNSEDEITNPNTSACLAEKEADLKEALERINRLEGQVRYFQDSDKANRKTNDNLKLLHQNLKAADRTRKTEWVAKEKVYKEEIAGLTERLTGVNEWGSKEAGYKQQVRQLEDNVKQLQENLKEGCTKFKELEREHRRCKTTTWERVRKWNETLESQHNEEVDKSQKEAAASAAIQNQRLEEKNDKLVRAIMQQMDTRSLTSRDYELITAAPAYWSSKTALELKHILDMTPVNPSKVESGNAFARLMKLCDTAYKFAVIMRRSDSLMRIEMPSVGTIIDEVEHNPLHQEGDQSLPQGNTIKCAITGALVYYMVATYDRSILIKANVTI